MEVNRKATLGFSDKFKVSQSGVELKKELPHQIILEGFGLSFFCVLRIEDKLSRILRVISGCLGYIRLEPIQSLIYFVNLVLYWFFIESELHMMRTEYLLSWMSTYYSR